MAVKLVVIYPRPNDIEAFETVYNRDHVPMAVAKLAGKTKIVATRILGSPANEQQQPTALRIKPKTIITGDFWLTSRDLPFSLVLPQLFDAGPPDVIGFQHTIRGLRS